MTNLERRQVLDRTKALQSVGVNISVMDTLRNPGMLSELEKQVSTGQTQEIATTEEQQMQGLQNRPPSQIPDQYVMKNVAPNSTIHTNNVKAPLDIDYKDPATGHLVESYKSVQPGTVLPGTPHNQSVDVVESPAKSMMRLGGVRRKFQNAGREEFKTGVNSFVSGTPIQDTLNPFNNPFKTSKFIEPKIMGKSVSEYPKEETIQKASFVPYTGPGEGYVSPESLSIGLNPKIMKEDKRGNLVEGGDKLSEYNEPSGMSRLGNILANPVTSFAHLSKGQQIPGNMQIDGPNRNILDGVIDLVNPAAWVGYGNQAVTDVEQGNYKDAGINAISAVPGVGLFGKTAVQATKAGLPKIAKPFINRAKKQSIKFLDNTAEATRGINKSGQKLTKFDRVHSGTKAALAGAAVIEIPSVAKSVYDTIDQELAEKGNLDKMENLLNVLKYPYKTQDNIEEYQVPTPSNSKKYQTFCGT